MDSRAKVRGSRFRKVGAGERHEQALAWELKDRFAPYSHVALGELAAASIFLLKQSGAGCRSRPLSQQQVGCPRRRRMRAISWSWPKEIGPSRSRFTRQYHRFGDDPVAGGIMGPPDLA